MSEKYLIINADDFGMCHSYNQAVFDLLEGGYITSSTLMPTAPGRDEAVAWCGKKGVKRVGLHTTFTSEWPAWRWSSLSRLSSLEDEEGYLYRSCAEFWARAKKEDVETELDAQFAWFAGSGVFFSHADNHMGSVYPLGGPGAPDYLPLALERCRRYGVGFRLYRRWFWNNGQVIPRQAAEADIALAESLDVPMVDYLYAFPFSSPEGSRYEDVRDAACQLVRGMPEGISEIYFHPSVESEEVKKIVPSWQRRVWDYRLLMDGDFRRAVRDAGIELISYRQMQGIPA